MRIDCQVIPHSEQRYPTVGDWWTDADGWHFRVSRLGDLRYEMLVFLHELIEMLMCSLSLVQQGEVTTFDIEYERARAAGAKSAPCGCALWPEPGDDFHAPYHREHQVASVCEFMVAKFLGVEWKHYCEKIDGL
jgi:hypothetical protein